MTWETYNEEKHKEIDLWNCMNKSIDKFAMFKEPLSVTAEWYQKNKMGKICDQIKVITNNNIIVGFVILNISIINEELCIGINPIVTNPKYSGWGQKILKDLIVNYKKYLNIDVNNKVVFTAGIDEDNEISKHLFYKVGFKQTGMHEDKTFGYYSLYIEDMNNELER